MLSAERVPVLFIFTLILTAPALGNIQVRSLDCMPSQGATRDYWPTEGWIHSLPEEQGMDSSNLKDMMDYIEHNDINIHSVVIVRNGYIVHEEYPSPIYDENRTHLLYSVTKSFTSALIGIALDKAYIDNVSQTMLSFFPQYTVDNLDDRKERITLEHLLMMRAGMFWDESSAPFSSPDNGIYHINFGDGVEYALSLPMVAEPGEVWHYNTGASHLLSGIIHMTTNMTTLQFAQENLFDPLGISQVTWSRDLAGYYKGGFDLQLTTRDMAKFGYLFLNNGTWDEQQVISTNWINVSTSSLTRLDEDTGYGYQWWVMPSIGAYYAAGLYGQFIFVIPEYDLVVAFTSAIPMDEAHPHFDLLTTYIIPAILEEENLVTPTNLFLILVPIAVGISVLAVVIYRGMKRNSGSW
jgi:CubicO group peptidase (beta-lactamase class C family)